MEEREATTFLFGKGYLALLLLNVTVVHLRSTSLVRAAGTENQGDKLFQVCNECAQDISVPSRPQLALRLSGVSTSTWPIVEGLIPLAAKQGCNIDAGDDLKNLIEAGQGKNLFEWRRFQAAQHQASTVILQFAQL